MICSNCGQQIPDGSRFCPRCGRNPQGNAAPQGAPQGGYAPQNQGGYVPQNQGYAPQNQITPQQPMGYGYGPQPAPPSAGFGVAVRTDRSLLTYILLSIVTCGIYGYWFIYQMAQDANAMCEGDGESTPGLGAFIGLSLITCGIYSYYWQYKLANRLQANAPRYGIQIQESGSDIMLWLVLGLFIAFCNWVAMNILIKNMNRLAEAFNGVNGYYYQKQ